MITSKLRQQVEQRAAQLKAQLHVGEEPDLDVTVTAPEGMEWMSMGTLALHCGRVMMESDNEVWESIFNMMKDGLRPRTWRSDDGSAQTPAAEAPPTINVNLEGCDCAWASYPSTQHEGDCSSSPVLIPFAIPPLPTFLVALGDCNCPMGPIPRLESWMDGIGHDQKCPARPARVTLGIFGKTWMESRVIEYRSQSRHLTDEEARRALTAARWQWALVMTLLEGMSLVDWSVGNSQAVIDLFNQRDEVFASLAALARMEPLKRMAVSRYVKAIPPARTWAPVSDALGEAPTSSAMLVRYFEHLVEQVGAVHQEETCRRGKKT